MLAVDDINYDSHFKEVMRAADKLQGQARYEAVSKVWSAMIQLQPVGAWAKNTTGGWSYGSGVTNFGKSDTADLDAWFEQREAEEKALEAEEVDVETGPLDIYDVRAFIIADDDKYPDLLTDAEVSRATEAGFELWVRVMEDRKKLGKANLHIDDEYLDGLIKEIKDKTPEDKRAEFADVADLSEEEGTQVEGD